ncbi:MAG: hypothetical protein H6546_03040 [Chitinophagales bacterium]|nr:hypothetical protein [Chitinophagales bacterium]
MARFYKTSQTRQEDYTVDPRLYNALSGLGGRKTTTKATQDKLLKNHVNVVPDDIPDYTQVKQEYQSQVNELVSRLQQNPMEYKNLQPAIAELRSKMAADTSPGGRLYAFNKRAEDWNSRIDNATKLADGDQDVLDFYMSRLDASGGYIDELGRPVQIKSDFGKMWDQKAEQDYLKTIKTTITPKLLRDAEVKNLEIGSKYKDAVTLMTDLGYTEEDVADYIAGSITPDMLKSMRQTYDYAISRGMKPADSFVDFVTDKAGSWTKAISGVKSANRSTIQFDTEAGMAAKEARAKAAAGPGPDIDNFAPVIGQMYETLTNPPANLRRAIAENRDGLVEISSLTDALTTASTGSNFGLQNAITSVAYNPKKKKFYYKSLYDLRTREELPEEQANEWKELSTETIRTLNVNNSKYKQSAMITLLKEMGMVNTRTQQFDFSGIIPEQEEDIDNEF